MAYRAPKSGIAADIQRKRQKEYKVSMENEVIDWIEYVLNEGKGEFVDFHEWLLDGTILCKLFNCIEPRSISPKHFRPTRAPFKQLDNIHMFLLACKDYGVKEGELFVSLDLHEASDLSQVISSIFALERVSFRKGWVGPRLKSREYMKQVLKLSRERLDEDFSSCRMWNQGGVSSSLIKYTKKALYLSRERLNEDYTSCGMWNHGGVSNSLIKNTKKLLYLSRERLNEDDTPCGMWNQGGLSKRSISLISIRQQYN